jgi:hypothetical protein
VEPEFPPHYEACDPHGNRKRTYAGQNRLSTHHTVSPNAAAVAWRVAVTIMRN